MSKLQCAATIMYGITSQETVILN